MKFNAFAGLLALGLVLSGCASMPEIPYDRQSAGDIKTIGVVTPRAPDEAQAILATTVGQSFGLVGALIDAGIAAERDKALNTILRNANVSPFDEFMARVRQGVTAHGFTLVDVPAARTRMDFLKPPYPAAQVDAYLDIVVIGYGYIAAGIGSGTPYRPHFWAKVRLVRARDNAVLMQDTVVYNPYAMFAQADKAVTISPDPQYVFTDFKLLKENPSLAVKGTQDAAQKAGDAVAALLR